MSLTKYKQKRNFKISPEPSGDSRPAKPAKHPLAYVIQKHRATSLHYDLRLEFHGVLLSWAVPKGPSLDPSVRRLAMQVEDHPFDYRNFEGVIPEGEYGGGTVMVWDRGEWVPEIPDVEAALEKGDLKFAIMGEKLHGSWVLVRTRGYGSKPDKSWLLIKHRDKYASQEDVTVKEPRSVISHKLLADIARDNGGNVEVAATGDPAKSPKSTKQTSATAVARKKQRKPKKAN